ncbi:MAG: serine hydrolase domain-containing protein [Chitinophagaceae bacterium]
MPKNIYTLFLLTAFLPPTGFTQTINITKLDSLFTSLAVNNKAMGSIAISKNGKLLYRKTIGYSLYSSENKIPSTDSSKYRIGSVSKIFTATIIFQLVEEGKISLDDVLEYYFPHYPKSKKITVANLLNHRSGIRNISMVEPKEKARTHEEMLAIIAEKPPRYKPGTKSYYSNANYLLLGYIIEKICNKSYAEVLRERIVSKAGLTNTYYGHKTNTEKNECLPYKFNRDWEQQSETDLSIPGASGALVSNPADMVLFIEALFSKKLIGENSLKQMTAITDGLGMGFLEFEFDKKKALGYTGSIDGNESVLAYFAGDSLSIAWCSNGRTYPSRSIVLGSLNIYFNNAYNVPDFAVPNIKPGHLKKYTGIYSSGEIPVRIKIRKQKQNLVAQPAGYASYLLEATGIDKFRNDEASVAIEFDLKKNTMQLKREDKSYNFTKEN